MARQDINIIPFDYEHFAEAMISYLKVTAPDDYLDFLESNASRVLIDAISFGMGLLGFMVNVNLQQMFIPTATTRRSMYLLGKLVDYDLRGPVTSQVGLRFSIDRPHDSDILIPKGTQVQTVGSSSQVFETSEGARITTGETSIDVSARHGVTRREIVGTTSINNEASQKFKTTRSPILDSVSLTIDGIVWSKVSNLFELSETDRGYTVRSDKDGLAEIRFGDGIFGIIPPAGRNIEVTYLTGGGAVSNVVKNTITEILSTLVDNDGEIVDVSVTNPDSASGGQNEETIEEARNNIPRSVRSMDRFVSGEDFKSVPSLFDVIGAERIFKSNAKSKYTWSTHHITIFVLGFPSSKSPNVPVTVDAATRNRIREFIDKRSLPTVEISVENATLKYVDITANVYYLSNYREDTVKENLNKSIDDLFNAKLREIGDGLRLSDVSAALDNTTGVNYVDITNMRTRFNDPPSSSYDPTRIEQPRNINADESSEFLVPGNTDFKMIRDSD